MGSRAVIKLGDVYEVLIQVAAKQELNERNTIAILEGIVKNTMRDNACWEIKVTTDYKDSQSSKPKANKNE